MRQRSQGLRATFSIFKRQHRYVLLACEYAQLANGLIDFDLQKHRRSDHSNPTSKTKWLHLALIGLSMFSTVFSGIYLGIALTHTTFRNETLISTAPELVTLFARVIELSFVAVFVAFVGQVISRKALMARNVKGITLVGPVSFPSFPSSIIRQGHLLMFLQAEISMRAWVRQPGLVFTQFSSLKSAMATKLGALTILAMLSNILYTTGEINLRFLYNLWITSTGSWRTKSEHQQAIPSCRRDFNSAILSRRN